MRDKPVFQDREAEDEAEHIRRIARRLATAVTKGELGQILGNEAARYTLQDLQILGGRMYGEFIRLPRPYRDQIYPYAIEQIFGAYHWLLIMYRSGEFRSMTGPITDRNTFDRFCAMIPDGCLRPDENSDRTPFRNAPQHRLFYYLMSAFSMFVLDRPGHPVGMPFPGGFKVEERNGEYYCLIRDKEKEVWFSICNFCPARQTEGV